MITKQTNDHANIVFTCSGTSKHSTELTAEEHSVVRILSGELKVIQADETYVFNAGDTHLFPRNRLALLVKSDKDGEPYRAIVVKLTHNILRSYYENIPSEINPVFKTDQIVNLDRSPLLDSFFDSMLPYFDLEYKLPQELSELKIREAITILRTVNRNVDAILSDFSEPHKINLVEFMQKNFMFNMSLEKFSYLTGRSLTTFKRDFSKAFNTTPQKWLTQKRLELAKFQLIEKKRKPIDVYFEVGFENLSHFSYAFKKQFGVNPRELMSH
ncbi:AraC family transcriptional regulator [Chryseobacterium sp. Leaf405]|uniref:AraC family transcriptional regulator n=1 Tax=Chryseobacterium sp. Leaf405 TaxID=1736367 RepID=UPI0006F5DB37|nr:AraC family transcriptional regulator [Chryseobacterium sp. Leaf405]KQT26165.1 AraC family transcriptional regulator [Chryseobacterium sp. Leaf405]